jgi:uncharacterized protein (TIGR04141 family)
MSEKIQNNFYLLKENIRIRNKKTRKIEEKQIDFEFLNKLLKGKNYKEQEVLPNLSKDYEVKVYFKRNKSPIKWKGFIKTIVAEEQAILKYDDNYVESYAILIRNIKTGKFYSSTGGYSHTIIQEIATSDFGINILARIVKPEDKALKSSKEKNLTGGVQATIKFFRNDYNLYENENFGNIYNELNAAISKKQLVEIFGFTIKDLRNDSLCIAKNSFSLKKSISFPELLSIISKCEKMLDNQKPLAEINNVEKVGKSSSILLEMLEEEVEKKIFANYQNPYSFFSVEVSHKDFEKYFSSSYSKLDITIQRKKITIEFDETIRDIQTILDALREYKNDLNFDDFQKGIDSAYFETFDNDGTLLTRDSLFAHFCSEVSVDAKSYFLIEKDWFEIRQSFIDKINEQCGSFIELNEYSGPVMQKWTGADENEYNASYLNKPNTFVFDKFTPQNIEACDIMKVDNDKVYYYHVKKGFNNSMRDLCNQVLIAARKISEDAKMKYIFHQMLYEKVALNNGDSDYFKEAKKALIKTAKGDFINLMKGKKIIFVLTVLDISNNRTLKKDLKKYKSNIAKFCLNELAKNMRGLGVEFQILQLEK